MDKIIYGADTETVHGIPNTLQFYSEDIPCEDIYFVDAKTAAKKFLEWCGRRRRNMQHVVYIHNLDFDLISLFWSAKNHARLVSNGGEFEWTAGEWTIRGLYGQPTFCTLRRRAHDLSVTLVDSFSFYQGSLARAADLFCPELPKLTRPADLGEHRYTAKDTDFVSYAMRDAEIAYHIGRWVESLHSEFDLKQCVSIADMAARVFRHKYLTYTIPQPKPDVVHAALAAYHGGKNNITVPHPRWYTGVNSIDISSAYPHAMSEMPAFASANAYRTLRATTARSVPRWGIYQVCGESKRCPWPSLFDHAFKPLCGSVEAVWITGHELNEALRSREFKPRKIIGYFYDEDRDPQAPALRAFCEDLYVRKRDESDPIRRHGYKIILNAVYGKFIQTRKRTLMCYVDIDSGAVTDSAELIAGGMFHSFIAANICGHTRARMHGLEHQYEALHTATDGIFTQKKPGREVKPKGRALGDLTLEGQGELLLIRNKCYILYSDAGKIESKAFEGKRILKFAKHGFQGSVHELEKMIATGRRKYTVARPNRLKESVKRGLTPNDFVEREYTLKVGPISLA